MFRSKSITEHQMERAGAADWAEVYQRYMQRLHVEQRLANDYLQDWHTIKAHQPLTAAGIMRLLRSDSMINLIVGATDGKFYLLSVENDTFQVAGISGRAFTSKYRQIIGTTSSAFFETTTKRMPIHSGERGAQLWVNEQFTELDQYHSNKKDCLQIKMVAYRSRRG
jgi:hypothetical protein